MELHIQRYRWIVVKDGKEIFCGLAQSQQGYGFKGFDKADDKDIKLYPTLKIAIKDFKQHFQKADELIAACRIEFVHVVEQVYTLGFHEWLNEEDQK